MRRMRNASTWRESIYSSISDNGSPTNASPRRQVSFATLPDKEKSGSSQPEDDANNGNPVEEEEMAELAPTDAETPRPARNFSASELRLEQALTEDVYSLMYTAPFSSTAFVFAYVAFFIQFSILLMICKSPQHLARACGTLRLLLFALPFSFLIQFMPCSN